jgi:sporulation protein YlmC with PRC-barrel domain
LSASKICIRIDCHTKKSNRKFIKSSLRNHFTKRELRNMAKQEKAVTKDMLLDMQVIDAEGYQIGTVKDVAFTVGKMDVSLCVEGKKGESRNITWDQIQSVGDYVILKPGALREPEPQKIEQKCPTCGKKLQYIPEYQRWYCNKCKKYT